MVLPFIASPETRPGWLNKRSVGRARKGSGRSPTFRRLRLMMLDEKKSRETSQDIQAELSKDGNSDPLQEAKGNAGSDDAAFVDGEDRVNFFVWLLVACSSISGLLFGAPQFIPASRLRSLTYGAVNFRLRYWCHLWCACYHRFRSWSNGALLWSEGLFS